MAAGSGRRRSSPIGSVWTGSTMPSPHTRTRAPSKSRSRSARRRRSMTPEPVRHEKYTHGHAPATLRQHAQRTADEAAAFLLPHLRPGMRLLDVGCGPGSITRGFAERLAKRQVVGIDLSRAALDGARRDAADRGLTNLQYEEGSVYQL